MSLLYWGPQSWSQVWPPQRQAAFQLVSLLYILVPGIVPPSFQFVELHGGPVGPFEDKMIPGRLLPRAPQE